MAKQVLGLTLPLRRGPGGYFESTTDVMMQLRTNLANLLLTQRGERPMQPNFGCDLPLVLFQPQTDDGLAEINGIIQSAVETWMPFLRVDDVNVTRDDDANRILLSLRFTLLTNNASDTLTLVI